MGSLEIGRVLYCVNGWNQLPVESLRKRWMRGRSRALSAQERLLVNSILLAAGAPSGAGPSDEEPDGCADTWARETCGARLVDAVLQGPKGSRRSGV